MGVSAILGAAGVGSISLGAAIAHDYIKGEYDNRKVEKIVNDVADEVADEYDLYAGEINALEIVISSEELGSKVNKYKNQQKDIKIGELQEQLEETWKDLTDSDYFDKDGSIIIEEYFRKLNRNLVADSDVYRVIIFDYLVYIRENVGSEHMADDFREIQEMANRLEAVVGDIEDEVERLRRVHDIDPEVASDLDEVNDIIVDAFSGSATEKELKQRIRGVVSDDDIVEELISVIDSSLLLDKMAVYSDADKLGTELGPPRSDQDYGWGETPRAAILSIVQKQVAFSPFGTEIISEDPAGLLNIKKADVPCIDWEDVETTDLNVSCRQIEQANGPELVRIKIENICIEVAYTSGSAEVIFETIITVLKDQYTKSSNLFNHVGLGWKAERISTD